MVCAGGGRWVLPPTRRGPGVAMGRLWGREGAGEGCSAQPERAASRLAWADPGAFPLLPGLRGVYIILHSDMKMGHTAFVPPASSRAGIVTAASTDGQPWQEIKPWQRMGPDCPCAVLSPCPCFNDGKIPRLGSGRRGLGVRCCGRTGGERIPPAWCNLYSLCRQRKLSLAVLAMSTNRKISITFHPLESHRSNGGF